MEVEAIEQTQSGLLLAGGEGLWRSEDDGQTWEAIDAPSSIRLLAVAPEGRIYMATFEQLYHSQDEGQTWTPIADHPGLRQLLVDAEGHLFARTRDERAVASWDGGLTWDTLDTGLPSRAGVVSLALDEDSYLYAGTYRAGVWRSAVPTAVGRDRVSPPPSALTLTTYPNPFKGETTLRFTLPSAAAVRLTLYDVLGRRLAVVAEATYPAGTHSVRVDGTTLPAGVYSLRLEAGPLVDVARIVRVK